MDRHARLYMAIGWFAIVYMVYVVANSLVPGYLIKLSLEHSTAPVGSAAWNAPAAHLALFLAVLNVAMKCCLSVCIAAIAWLLRAEHAADIAVAPVTRSGGGEAA